MKRYQMTVMPEGNVHPKASKTGDWAPAEVANDLYEALAFLVKVSYEGVMTPEDRDIAEKALEAADRPLRRC